LQPFKNCCDIKVKTKLNFLVMRTNVKLKLFAMAATIIALAGCSDYHRIEGNNHPVTENRNLSGFTEVNLSSDFQVIIKHDSVFSVTVEAEENLLPYIETEMGGGVLHIGVQRNHHLSPNYPIKVTVQMPELSGARLSGSGTMLCDTFTTQQMVTDISGSGTIKMGLHANKIFADISGSGELNLAGTVNDADLSISGSGDIFALPLLANTCKANISGSGNIYITVANSLDVRISGSGNVYYSGSPSVNASISGSGKVIHNN
jgi:hypothetical protein